MINNSLIESKEVSLYSLANWRNGLAYKDIEFSNSGLPIIKIAELKNGISDQTKFTHNMFDKNVFLHNGDIVFSWSGNPETSIDTFIYRLSDGWLNQHIFKVEPTNINRRFFYFLMKSLNPIFQRIASNKQTTGLGHVTIADLKRLKVTIPSLEEQQHIVNILGSIDDKIENLEKINKNLIYLVQTEFNSIYSTILNTNNTKISNQLQMMVSGDWGKDCPDENYKTLVKCIRGADIPNAKLCNFNQLPNRYILEKNVLKCGLKAYDVIIELSGGSPTQSTGRCCIIPPKAIDANIKYISTNFCKVLRFKNKEEAVFCYLLLSQWYNNKLFFNYEIGTTGLKNLNLDAILNLDIKEPSADQLHSIYSIFNNCYLKIVKNANTILKLNELKQLYLKKFFG